MALQGPSVKPPRRLPQTGEAAAVGSQSPGQTLRNSTMLGLIQMFSNLYNLACKVYSIPNKTHLNRDSERFSINNSAPLELCVCVCVCVCVHAHAHTCSVMSDSLWPHRLCSPPGSSVHGIFQKRILEWVAISLSRGSFWPRDWTCIFCVFCIAGEFFTKCGTYYPNSQGYWSSGL